MSTPEQPGDAPSDAELREYERTMLLSLGPRYAAIEPYMDIHGWLTVREAVALFELAAGLPQVRPRVVEIGSWVGKSSFVLAKGLEGKTRPTLYCIDPFNADGDALSTSDYAKTSDSWSKPLKDVFLDNMRRLGVDGVIEVLEGYSSDLVEDFRAGVDQVDMLFIGGNHDERSVDEDYVNWSPLVRPGGIIAFRNVAQEGAQLGPWLVAKSRVVENAAWQGAAQVDSLLVARRMGG